MEFISLSNFPEAKNDFTALTTKSPTMLQQENGCALLTRNGFRASALVRCLLCRLKRSIYGLKQSPRAWFDKLSAVVLSYGFRRAYSDHSVFVRQQTSGVIILVFYVDDIIVTGSDNEGIVELKAHLNKDFQTKDLGHLRDFLGIEVARSKYGVSLSQRKYLTYLLSESGMLGARPAETPMDSNVKFEAEQGELCSAPGRYRRLVGKLIYLTVTRPDIAFAVGVVSQFMHAPRQPHWEAVCRILRYLKNAPGKGLMYRPSDSLDMKGFSDADWAGNHDDRRSTSGYCTFSNMEEQEAECSGPIECRG